jgi:hypothetical protein
MVLKLIVAAVMMIVASSLRSSMTMSSGGVKKVAILGASGYTGAELMRSASNRALGSRCCRIMSIIISYRRSWVGRVALPYSMFENHAIQVLTVHIYLSFRLLSLHDGVKVEVLTATDRNAGQPFKNIYPQFSYLSGLPLLTKWEVSSIISFSTSYYERNDSTRSKLFFDSILEHDDICLVRT